ncbi:MAG: hypothetical protein V4459_00745, partial [Pseudomonadota bacterium]
AGGAARICRRQIHLMRPPPLLSTSSCLTPCFAMLPAAMLSFQLLGQALFHVPDMRLAIGEGDRPRDTAVEIPVAASAGVLVNMGIASAPNMEA